MLFFKRPSDREAKQVAEIIARLRRVRTVAGPTYAYARTLRDVPHAKVVATWIYRSREIAKEQGLNDGVDDAFCHLLMYIWATSYIGAHHASSAALFVVLSELGLKPQLAIGQVQAPRSWFVHSWVELDRQVFDAAISLPVPKEEDVGGPVFASRSLDNLQPTHLGFGVGSEYASDGIFTRVQAMDLATYGVEAQAASPVTLWSLAAAILAVMDRAVTVAELKAKYGSVMRQPRGTGAPSPIAE